jgi:hypothetical protein
MPASRNSPRTRSAPRWLVQSADDATHVSHARTLARRGRSAGKPGRTRSTAKPDDSIANWLDPVGARRMSMSHRTLKWVEKHGGMQLALQMAGSRSVHLVRLGDAKGNVLLVACIEPFLTLC